MRLRRLERQLTGPTASLVHLPTLIDETFELDRYLSGAPSIVILDGSACFFGMDQQQRLVGALSLSQAQWLSAAVPTPFDTLSVRDTEHGVVFVTRRGLLGIRILDLRTKRTLYVTRFKGFTWNPRFGPDPPSHGLSLAPDRPELWVLDAPNSVVHVFDVSELPVRPPRRLEDIRLSKPISGDESPCTRACGRIGSMRPASRCAGLPTRQTSSPAAQIHSIPGSSAPASSLHLQGMCRRSKMTAAELQCRCCGSAMRRRGS